MNPRPLLSLLLAFLLALLLAGLAAAGGSGPAVAPRLAPPAPLNITFDSDVLSVAVQGDYAYVGLESGLVILDITNPLQPVRRGFLDTSVGFPPHFITSPRFLQIEGDLLVISNGSFIATVDVSNPDHPVLLSPYQQYTTYAVPFKLLNRYLYIVEAGRFHILDLHDPTQPQVIYSIEDDHLIGDICTIDAEVNPRDGHTYVYMGGRRWCFPSHGCVGFSFLVADVTDPANPQIEPLSRNGNISSLRIENSFIYLADYSSSVSILDATDPLHLQAAGSYSPSEHEALAILDVAGDRLMVGGQHRDVLFLANVSDKAHPQELSVHRDTAYTQFVVSPKKDCAFVAERERGLHILCDAHTYPQPPSLVWLPMVQRSESG